MNIVIQSLWVGIAGFAGALARWGIMLLFGRFFGAIRFPAATFFINISGSFFLGWFYNFIDRRYPAHVTFRLAIATGFVGAYTTFSTFMYETTKLTEEGAAYEAVINLLGSLIVGLAAMKLGLELGKR